MRKTLGIVMTVLVLLVAANAEAATPHVVQARAKQVTSGELDSLAFASPNTAVT